MKTKLPNTRNQRRLAKTTPVAARRPPHEQTHTAIASRLAPNKNSIVATRVEPLAEAVTQPLPPIQVKHDRKQHFDVAAPPATAPQQAPGSYRPSTGISHPPDFNDDQPPTSTPGHPAAHPEASVFLSAPPASSADRVSSLASTAPPPMAAQLAASIPSIEDQVTQTRLVQPLFNKRGQLIMPPALKGSHDILVHQNTEADREGLARIRDEEDLLRLRERKALVALPVVQGLAIDERLPGNRRYTRPWTAQFLAELARAHFARFHSELIVTSAVRTVEVQQRLLRTNGNAAPVEGETASPHLTGQAVDIGKKGLSLTEIAWLRGYLLPLLQQGKVDVEEEFQQACFHISVYREYLPQTAWPRTVDQNHHSVGSSLATAIHE